MILRDWEKALTEAAFDVPLNKRQFNINCPFHKDSHPSLSISLDKGVWICHAGCGSGSLSKLISEALGISLLEAERLAIDDQVSEFDIILNLKPQIIKDNVLLEKISLPFESGIVPEWIFDRGFSKEALKKWECTYNPKNRSLVIPVKDEYNRLVGWIERFPPGSSFRYYNNIKKSEILFGASLLLHNSSYICLTEGPLDTIWLDQNNFSAVAILGVYLSKKQELLLKNIGVGEIVLCLDNDEAGKLGADTIAKRLSKYCIISKIDLPQECKDVQNVRNSEKLKQIIDNRIYY
ncbi:MAG: toprim domain-containing protein [Nanoarchaeota archaeon]